MSCGLSQTPDGSVTRMDTRTGTTARPRTATEARENLTSRTCGGDLSAETSAGRSAVAPAQAGGVPVAISAPDSATATVRWAAVVARPRVCGATAERTGTPLLGGRLTSSSTAAPPRFTTVAYPTF